MKQSTIVIALGASLLATASSSGAINIVNALFDGTDNAHNYKHTTDTGPPVVRGQDGVDAGWYTKDFWTIDGSNDLVHDTGDNWSVSQVVSRGSETGTNLELSFTYTTGTIASSTLEYQLIGWDSANTPAEDDIFFNGNNFGGAQVRPAGGEGWVDFLDGSFATGNANAAKGTVISSLGIGVPTSVSIDLTDAKFSGLDSSLKDISGYEFIGVRFNIAGDNNGAIGSVISDINLTTIPEPGSATLLGLTALGFVLRRRR